MRFALVALSGALLSLCPALPLGAQGRTPPRTTLSAADSQLVGSILLAEDRRAAGSAAVAAGVRHRDPEIRRIALRADARIRDSTFSARDTLPALPAPHQWPEPAWRIQYRALSDDHDCQALAAALTASSWPVRLHAADLAAEPCPSVVATLRRWIDEIPSDLTRRPPGGVSWHAAAHALLALGRLEPETARELLQRFSSSPSQHLRRYAARTAALIEDTSILRTLLGDSDPNVREAAIEGVRKSIGHNGDSIFVSALNDSFPQVVRAAAIALRQSPDSVARKAAATAYERWVARDGDSERDVRLALLAAAGLPPSRDRAPHHDSALPSRAVELALGADVPLRVTMAESSGGGSFVVRLRGDAAPITAARILELVTQGYYNGLTWHRVEHDFVIQGGSPGWNEYSGYPRYFRDELSTVSNLRGTVGMSTRGHDTGDAQWFINLRDNPRLDRSYTVFAEVTEGMDVVDGIMEGDVIESIELVER